MLTQERLQELICYDPENGEFRRRVDLGVVARHRERVGTIDPTNGYLRISVDCRRYYAHRLAWLYITGRFPDHEVDHKNRIRADNRFDNLRAATRTENGRNLTRRTNNTSGVPGVSWDRSKSRWAAYINPNRRKRHVGYFGSLEAAAAARVKAEAKYFGEFRTL